MYGKPNSFKEEPRIITCLEATESYGIQVGNAALVLLIEIENMYRIVCVYQMYSWINSHKGCNKHLD